MADRTSPAYEAAIALGLAACNVVDQGLPFTGENHFEAFKKVTFRGVEADVKFLNESGTRDPNTTLFAVENEVEEVVVVNINGTQRTMVKFHSEVSDIYDHGVWEHLEDFIFNDGTTTIQPDLTPADDVVHHYIHTPLKVMAGLLYFLIIALAVRFFWWTEKNKKERVVRASQPLFLRVILVGVMIFATSIVPLNIDDRVASIKGCSRACNFYYWFFFLGFSVMFSGLFTKIYRVNQIMNNPVKFKRVKVTVRDVIKPMAAIIGINFLLLIIMTAAAPSEWVIEVSQYDEHGRPTETYGHCTSKEQLPYYITLGIVNFSLLVFAMKQAYDTRKLATEFSESRYIFYAMIGIVVALFQGIPVLVLVRDDPAVQDFIKCSVIFVTCCSVLLFLFVPKQKFLIKQLRKSKAQRLNESIKVSGLEPADYSRQVNGSGPLYDNSSKSAPTSPILRKDVVKNNSSVSGVSGCSTEASGSSEEGFRFTMKNAAQLNQENMELRRKLNMKNVSLGTLATESSASEGSGGSSGIKILARKSTGELLQENRKLKKMLKAAKKKPGIQEQAIMEENPDDSEANEEKKPRKRKTSIKQVSFRLDRGLQQAQTALGGSMPSLRPLVMPTESEGGVSVDSIDYQRVSNVSNEDIEAANARNSGVVPLLPSNHDEDDGVDSDDDTAPNSSDNTADNTALASSDDLGRFRSESTEPSEFSSEFRFELVGEDEAETFSNEDENV